MTEQTGNKGPAVSRFTRSVNIERDLWEAESLQGYLVTAGARRALLRIAPALHTPNAARAWTLTGPYGTGKSALANFTAKLMAGEVVPGHASAWKLLNASDSDLARQVRPSRKATPALLPIGITGSREPLQLAILRGLHGALGRLRGRRCSRVMARVNEALAETTSGKQPSAHAIAELFGEALDAACSTGQVGGFFLVIDELGELLEYATAHPANSDLYTLQSLAEFAARTPQPFLILGILHQDFSLYADRLTGRERAEWGKVRGRFEDIAFNEPADELLRLIALARSQSPEGSKFDQLPAKSQKHFRDLCREAWKLELAPQHMTEGEFFEILLRCYPLHPLATLVLVPLFRKLAQNERSVFSFLESSEPHGLREHLQDRICNVGQVANLPEMRQIGNLPHDHLYCLHHLYDYLLGSIGEALYVQMHGKRWAEIETVLASLPKATELDIALVKTIGLLGAMGQWRNLLATEKVLRLALCHIPPNNIRPALQGLTTKRAVIDRRYNRSFGLWEGSDIDFGEHIRTARGRVDPNQATAVLAAHFAAPRPLVAKRHSFTTGSLRYFGVRFVGPGGFTAVIEQPRKIGDGQILILLPDKTDSGASIEDLAVDPRLRERLDILVVVPAETRSLADILHELASLEWMQRNTPGLEGDATARRELRARLAAQRRSLDQILAPILAPGDCDVPVATWFHRGKKQRISSRKGLQDYISRLCDETYSSTPQIRNELINRRELSSAAAAARRNLIEAMIDRGDQPELGIGGTPPEKSMYLSLLRQTGIHRKTGNGWHFDAPSPGPENEGIRKVWSAIADYFRQSEREAGPVTTLYERLAAPPYGVLAGPMPVLLCAALLANDNRVALYEEGSFIPQLNTAAFERLLRAPERFSVQQWRLTGVRTTVFHRLAELLDLEVSDAAPDKGDILTVVRPLCRFVTRLNEYARRTQRVSPLAQQIREHLSTARHPDKLLFEALPGACGIPPIVPRGKFTADQLSSFTAALRGGLSELQRCYDELLVDLTRSIGRAFAIEGSRNQVRLRLAERGEAIKDWVADPALKAFILRVADQNFDDILWIESVVALLTNKPPSGWRDDDRPTFEIALTNMARLFAHVERLAFSTPIAQAQRNDEDAIRVGITTRTDPEFEQVIHLAAEDRKEVARLESLVRRTLDRAGVNGNGQAAAAALARVMQKLLVQDTMTLDATTGLAPVER